MAEEYDQLIAAATEQQVFGLNIQHVGKLLLKVECAAVGIPVHFGNRLLHRFDGQGRRPQLVLV